jgi:AraC family transcriptional regulator, regulatory protein of adaptative response / DNA-3-methyladenine glycosylase II
VATDHADDMHDDVERCIRAVRSKDARFDGWFFGAVITTGIYCRPSCPVVPPKIENMRFYPSAAAAQLAGFRACKRCRPDASPGSPEWNERADVVARAMRMIADGVVDRDGVSGLVAQLGHLHTPDLGIRLAARELGLPVTPVALTRHAAACRRMAALARLRRSVPLGHRRSPDQPATRRLNSRTGQIHVKDPR